MWCSERINSSTRSNNMTPKKCLTSIGLRKKRTADAEASRKILTLIEKSVGGLRIGEQITKGEDPGEPLAGNPNPMALPMRGAKKPDETAG